MMIFKSRFTPGMKDGRDVSFTKGETVTTRSESGKIEKAIINSDLKSHDEAPGDKTGYECIFPDGEFFVPREGIIDWVGKHDLEAKETGASR